jgi:hypothetical protein
MIFISVHTPSVQVHGTPLDVYPERRRTRGHESLVAHFPADFPAILLVLLVFGVLAVLVVF